VSPTPLAATYRVAPASYSLAFSATTGPCWVEVTGAAASGPSSGSVLFAATLSPGQSQTLDVSGPVTVVAGAPSAFAATVDGVPVTLPAGAQGPVTLTFETSASV
jgi:hypothetical protein